MWMKRGVFFRGIAETECITSFGFGAKVELWSLPCAGNVKQEKMRNEEDAPQTCSTVRDVSTSRIVFVVVSGCC